MTTPYSQLHQTCLSISLSLPSLTRNVDVKDAKKSKHFLKKRNYL